MHLNTQYKVFIISAKPSTSVDVHEYCHPPLSSVLKVDSPKNSTRMLEITLTWYFGKFEVFMLDFWLGMMPLLDGWGRLPHHDWRAARPTKILTSKTGAACMRRSFPAAIEAASLIAVPYLNFFGSR